MKEQHQSTCEIRLNNRINHTSFFIAIIKCQMNCIATHHLILTNTRRHRMSSYSYSSVNEYRNDKRCKNIAAAWGLAQNGLLPPIMCLWGQWGYGKFEVAYDFSMRCLQMAQQTLKVNHSNFSKVKWDELLGYSGENAM